MNTMSQSFRDFLADHREGIVERVRARVVRRTPSQVEPLMHGIPLFLTQLGEALGPQSNPGTVQHIATGQELRSQRIMESAALHGQELLRNGFSVAQVVHGYGDVCQVVTELATEKAVVITSEEFQAFNGFLDDAIAGAVTAYATLRERDLAYAGTERLGVLAHELRNLLNSAVLSFDIIKKGVVGLGGSTSAMHSRSLAGLRALVERSFAEVRLDAGEPRLENLALAEFLEEVQVCAAMEAEGKGVLFDVSPVGRNIRIDVDRQLLASAITNLLQNAFKFTRRRGRVALTTRITRETVILDVSDECGGLPPGKVDELFRPFKQGSQDHSGLGLGLAIALRAVHANSGELHVRNFPGKGCTFSVQLPRGRDLVAKFHVLPSPRQASDGNNAEFRRNGGAHERDPI